MFVLQPLVLAGSNRGNANRCLVCKAARFIPPQAARYTKGTTRHRSRVPELSDAVNVIDAALSTSHDGTLHSVRASGSPHRHCSSSRLEATDEVKEAWRRLPCPPRILRPTHSDVSHPEQQHQLPSFCTLSAEQHERTKLSLQKSLMRVGLRSGLERSFRADV